MKIWTPLLRETKEKLERGIRVKRSIQESPWNLTFASVNGYDFLNNMQMKKTQTFPPTKRAIPIVGWYRFCGEFTHPAREIDFLYYGSKEVESVKGRNGREGSVKYMVIEKVRSQSGDCL